MSGRISFKIDLINERPELLPELSGRLKDLRPAFDAIERGWARDNQDKFNASKGAEASGAEVDPEVIWKRLTPGYMIAKRKAGFADQIMVRTGATAAALSNPEGFFRENAMLEAAFGTPMDPEVLARIGYNWLKRQVIFLSVDDQRMIDKKINDYLSLGENFEEILFAKGMANVQKRNQSAQMDIDFGDTVG